LARPRCLARRLGRSGRLKTMPLLRLIAENVGPFERLEIDFSDGKGKPNRGPHILAGVNGSGKSTVLRAIAWAMSWDRYGFPEEEWKHFLRGPGSRSFVHVAPDQGPAYLVGVSASADDGFFEKQQALATSLGLGGLEDKGHQRSGPIWLRHGGSAAANHRPPMMCAYAPARALAHLDTTAKMRPLSQSTDDCLAFDAAVQNGALQDWWVGLFSRRALAKERGEEFASYDQTISRFQAALKLVCDDNEMRIDVELGRVLEPRVTLHKKRLNFSQLSDGIRTTIGWLADFMMRQDQIEATNGVEATRDGLLLLDEIDIYLHPRWQRTLLPAMRKALPEVQIIASSHSPFVISSCRDARIHVLNLDAEGVARAEAPQDAPFGESVTATLKDIFGVESRFDVETEGDLKEWDRLKREDAVGKLAPSMQERLDALSDELSERSEELKLIVKSPRALPASALDSLIGGRTRSPKRNGSRVPRNAKLG